MPEGVVDRVQGEPKPAPGANPDQQATPPAEEKSGDRLDRSGPSMPSTGYQR